MRTFTRAVAAAAALLASSACVVHNTDVPTPAGPSETALSLKMTMTPDAISQDGASQSALGVQAFDAAGKPVAGLVVRLDMAVNGVVGDFGSFSARSLVTGTDGKALSVYTAPPPPSAGGLGTTVTIVGTPTGTNAGSTNFFTTQIRLTPVGSVPPPQGPPSSVPPPTPNFTFSPSAPAVGESVFFNAGTSKPASGHSITSYSWIFGDGGTASGVTTTHAFTASGSYGVQLTVTDDVGQSITSAPTAVTVGTPPTPTANFTFSPGTPGRNDQVVFDASSSVTAQGQTITDVAWNFGDGTAVIHCPSTDPACITTNGSNRISVHTYALNQTFTVNLVVTDSAGRTGSKSAQITVDRALPDVHITASPGSPKVGSATVFFNSNATLYFPGSGPGTFSWSFGDGNGSALANPQNTYVAAGTYNVVLTVTDNKGRTGVGTVSVTVVP
jgi:PKD repeat protein